MTAYDVLADPLAMTVFVLTLSLPVVVGALTARRIRSQSEFLLGGRTMGRLVVALSAVSSGRSSWLVLGVSGMAYAMGVGAVWALVGYTVVEMLQFVVVGRRLRTASERSGALTVLDALDARTGSRGPAVRLVGALIIGLFLTAYVAAQFSGGARALSAALDLPLPAALGISAALVLVYMVLGGFVAVAYNDVVRAVIMIVGLVVFPAVALVHIGGLDPLLTTLQALDPTLVDPWSLGAGAIVGFLAIGLGSPGQPHIVVRYMSIGDPRELRAAAVIGTFWNVVMGWGALFIGLLGRAAIPSAEALPDGDAEMIVLALASGSVGPVMVGLLVGGIFAAILSTADSQLLVVASTAVRDVYEQVFHRGEVLSERRKLALSRAVVVAAGLAAIVLALLAKDLVFWLVLFAWGGLGAAFGPALILSLWWDRCSRAGVLGGMVTGALATVIWKVDLPWWTSLKSATGIYELLVAFPLALAAVVALSLALPDAGAGPATPGARARPWDRVSGGAEDDR